VVPRIKRKKGSQTAFELKQAMKPTVVEYSSKEEFKYVPTVASNNATVSSVGTITKLTTIVAGTGPSARTGDEVGLVSWSMNIGVHASGSDVNGAEVRCIILRWNDSDGAIAPTVASVLEFTTAAYAACSHYNQQGVREGYFSVLFDKTYCVAANGPVVAADRVFGKLPSLMLRFDPGGGAGGAGHLYSILISSNAALLPSVNLVTRVFYEDS